MEAITFHHCGEFDGVSGVGPVNLVSAISSVAELFKPGFLYQKTPRKFCGAFFVPSVTDLDKQV